jgi:hypothetical protein
MTFHDPLPVCEQDRVAEGVEAANELVDRGII